MLALAAVLMLIPGTVTDIVGAVCILAAWLADRFLLKPNGEATQDA